MTINEHHQNTWLILWIDLNDDRLATSYVVLIGPIDVECSLVTCAACVDGDLVHRSYPSFS